MNIFGADGALEARRWKPLSTQFEAALPFHLVFVERRAQSILGVKGGGGGSEKNNVGTAGAADAPDKERFSARQTALTRGQ